jgi:glycosyltransferase 2 family protein
MAADVAYESAHLFGQKLVRKLVAPIALAAVAYAALLLYGDAPAVATSLRGLRMITLAEALAVSLGSFALRRLRWSVYLDVMKLRVPAMDSTLVFLAGLGMSITPGKVGELLKSLLLKERFEIAIARSAPIVIAERAMDFGALVLLGGVSFGWGRSPWVTVVLAALFLGALFALGGSRRAGLLLTNFAGRLPVIGRRRHKIAEALESLHELWAIGPFMLGMSLSIVAWGFQALTITIFADAFDGHQLSLGSALIAYSAPLLAGALALIPGGLGLTEASMAGALRVLTNMSSPSAVAVTILTRLVTFWLAVFLGFAALATWRLQRRPVSPMETAE